MGAAGGMPPDHRNKRLTIIGITGLVVLAIIGVITISVFLYEILKNGVIIYEWPVNYFWNIANIIVFIVSVLIGLVAILIAAALILLCGGAVCLAVLSGLSKIGGWAFKEGEDFLVLARRHVLNMFRENAVVSSLLILFFLLQFTIFNVDVDDTKISWILSSYSVGLYTIIIVFIFGSMAARIASIFLLFFLFAPTLYIFIIQIGAAGSSLLQILQDRIDSIEQHPLQVDHYFIILTIFFAVSSMIVPFALRRRTDPAPGAGD